MRAVDLFAGWGGFTLGAELAGVEVVWAANHWPLAVEAHALNHPRTAHACQDLRQADWTALPRYDLLLAAPACQGHSQASQPGRRPHHDADRATAWAVVDCAEVTRPRALVVENVPQFMRWQLFPVWRLALETLGYHLQVLKLDAARHGVPQRRTRLFIVGTRKPVRLALPRARAELPIGPCLDWDDGEWLKVAAAPPAVRARIATGRARLGCRRFLSQHTTDHQGVPLDEPIRTITTKNQWNVVDGDRYRGLTKREHARAMGFPDSFTWPARATLKEVVRGLGNAVPPPLGRDVVGAVMEVA